MNSSEKIAQGANLIVEGLGDMFKEFSEALHKALKIFNVLQCQTSKKAEITQKN